METLLGDALSRLSRTQQMKAPACTGSSPRKQAIRRTEIRS
jgi:hypothetical protein